MPNALTLGLGAVLTGMLVTLMAGAAAKYAGFLIPAVVVYRAGRDLDNFKELTNDRRKAAKIYG